MVSITASWKNAASRLLAAAFCLWLCCGGAAAAEVEISNPQLLAVEDGYVLNAEFNIDFGPRLEEAVDKGLVLNFVVEFDLTRPRWYWLDEKLVSRSQTYRLSYHALTRQYRLSTGALHQSFASLSEALRMLSRLRNWLVIEKPVADKADKNDKALPKVGESYQAALRFRLDTTQLPRPFQIAALGSRDWNLGSDWKVWQLTLPPAESK